MGLFHWIIIGQAGLALSFVMIYASGFAGGGTAAGVGSESCWRFWRSVRVARSRDATISGKASGADKHRRLYRNDRYRRNRWRNLQISGCANVLTTESRRS